MAKKRRPEGPGRKPPADPRPHPLPGMLYRVRDKDWQDIWGERMQWSDAEKLRDKLLVDGKSRSARVEAMDMSPPENLVHDAQRARERHARRDAPTNYQFIPAPYQQTVEDPPLEKAPVLRSVPPPVPPPPTPPAPVVADQQLAAIQSSALGVAGQAASAAQVRSDAVQAAAKRREEYRRQREAAEKENERLQKEAEELEKQLGDASDVPEGDIDDFLGGVGAMPTDAEIAEAKRKANQ